MAITDLDETLPRNLLLAWHLLSGQVFCVLLGHHIVIEGIEELSPRAILQALIEVRWRCAALSYARRGTWKLALSYALLWLDKFLSDLLPAQVVEFSQAEEEGQSSHGQHKDNEDVLLRGPGDITVDRVGTGTPAADMQGVQEDPIKEVLAHNEGHLHGGADQDGADIGVEQSALEDYPPIHFLPAGQLCLLSHWVLIRASPTDLFGSLCFPELPLLLDTHSVHGMAHVHQRWRGDEDDLQYPVANVGYGEGLIIADIFTPRLNRITLEISLLIPPGRLSSCAQHEHAEYEQDSEPDLADHCGVLVYFLQELSQEAPVTHLGRGRGRMLRLLLLVLLPGISVGLFVL